MEANLTVPSSLIAPRASQPLAPAMLSALWEIAAVLDEQRTPAVVKDAIWLEIPTMRLRGDGARSDNIWLRQCLDRLTGIKLTGEYRGDAWGAVIVAEWHIIQGGTVARIMIPPAGVAALRAPETFTRIEVSAAHHLSGHARRLYAILADKKRLRLPTWTFQLDELRTLLNVADKPTYRLWSDFLKRVLHPAVKAINTYGTVTIKMSPQKLGRAVNAVRFDWQWKSIDEARETEEETERNSADRGKNQAETPAAPPLTDAENLLGVGDMPPRNSPEWRKKMGLSA